MEEVLQDFIGFLAKNNLAPANSSDIIGDDKRRDFRLVSDTPKKKKGFYKLEIEGGFGFGFAGDYRTGDYMSYHYKTNKSYTPDEIKEFKRIADAKRKKNEYARAKQHKLRAQEAKDSLLFLEDCPEDHPYLLKKGVKPHALLLSGNDIIIPMSDAGDIVNYQTITMTGEKMFLPDARKSGTWFKIAGDNSKICLCEGYATGASVFEATGYTVIVCFDAGNLIVVSKIIRELMPKGELIICADNDHAKKVQAKLHNTGLLKGTEAAKAIKAKICHPPFLVSEDELSDFNDYSQVHGLAAVGAVVEGAALPSEESKAEKKTTVAANDEGWVEKLVCDKKGNAVPRSAVNLSLIMEHSQELDGVFKYDSFDKRQIIHRCPPWEKDALFKVRRVRDDDYFSLEVFLEGRWGLATGKNKCADAIDHVSNLPKNNFNPASDYFNNLEWDGVKRINNWLADYVSDGKQSKAYLKLISRKFLCGMAARAMKPGVKFDTMLILEGAQYAGKSMLARRLSTIGGAEYFLDDFKDIDNKDALMKMQGKLIIEFPELSTMRKAEVSDLKAFVSRQEDEFRPPYGRNTIIAPRQCVFIGTVNPEGGYLRDITGNRRYWPVSCDDTIKIDELTLVIPQLHAEAAHLIKKGEEIHLVGDEYMLAKKEQKERVVEDVWMGDLEEIVRGQTSIASADLMKGLGITVDKKTPQQWARIKATMTQLGWEHGFSGKNRGYNKIVPVEAKPAPTKRKKEGEEAVTEWDV